MTTLQFNFEEWSFIYYLVSSTFSSKFGEVILVISPDDGSKKTVYLIPSHSPQTKLSLLFIFRDSHPSISFNILLIDIGYEFSSIGRLCVSQCKSLNSIKFLSLDILIVYPRIASGSSIINSVPFSLSFFIVHFE